MDYTYNGDHGDNVFLGIYVLHNGRRLSGFGWDEKIIRPGSGTVTTDIYIYSTPLPDANSDQIEVTFYANNDPLFYSQVFDYPMSWSDTR